MNTPPSKKYIWWHIENSVHQYISGDNGSKWYLVNKGNTFYIKGTNNLWSAKWEHLTTNNYKIYNSLEELIKDKFIELL